MKHIIVDSEIYDHQRYAAYFPKESTWAMMKQTLQVTPTRLIQTHPTTGGCLVHEIMNQGDLAFVKFIHEQTNFNLSCPHVKSFTPLMLAVCFKQLEIVKYLCEVVRVDVNILLSGRSALGLAVDNQCEEIAKYLSGECGADLTAVDELGRSILVRAISSGMTSFVDYLTNVLGVDVNDVANDGSTAISCAVGKGDFSSMVTMFHSGANVYSRTDKLGRNLVHCAALANNTNVLEWVCDVMHVPVDDLDASHLTPLQWALLFGNTPMVTFLTNYAKRET